MEVESVILNNFFYTKEFLEILRSEIELEMSPEKQNKIIKLHVKKFFSEISEEKQLKLEKLSKDFINIDQNNASLEIQNILIEFDKVLSLQKDDS